jgi:hypothetical protein
MLSGLSEPYGGAGDVRSGIEWKNQSEPIARGRALQLRVYTIGLDSLVVYFGG